MQWKVDLSPPLQSQALFPYETALIPISALWLSFASNPTGGPARWTVEEGYFAWPEYQQNTSSMLLFASGDTLQQLVTGERIDGNCTA
jgi:hypothetical protein